MNDEKIRELIRWDSADAEAIAQQLLARVRQAKARGQVVGVVTCIVYADEQGQRSYEPAFSVLPVEVTFWAADAIRRRVYEVNEEK